MPCGGAAAGRDDTAALRVKMRIAADRLVKLDALARVWHPGLDLL
jgi:hypothetical protein